MKRIISSANISPAVISNLKDLAVTAENTITILLESKGILTKYYDIEKEDFDVLDSAANILETIQASLEIKSRKGE